MKPTKDREISELETKTIVVYCDADKAVNVSFNMILSCIDGKVAGHIHHVCMQRCVCCEAKPNKMNQIENFTNGTFAVKNSERLKNGLSPYAFENPNSKGIAPSWLSF
jgi:hypothetical protein